MRAIVVGAGIGGLTVAIALHARGIECQVYESVREIAPLGVGINVLPHAMAELRELGLMERVAALGIATSELCFFNRHGQIIWREPRGIGAGYTVAQVSLHRGRFQLGGDRCVESPARSRAGDGHGRSAGTGGLRPDR